VGWGGLELDKFPSILILYDAHPSNCIPGPSTIEPHSLLDRVFKTLEISTSMKKTLKTFLVLLSVYLFTIILFVLKLSYSTHALYQFIKSDDINRSQLQKSILLAEEFHENAIVLNSELLMPAKFLLGERNSLTMLGDVLSAAAEVFISSAENVSNVYAKREFLPFQNLNVAFDEVSKSSAKIKFIFETLGELRFTGLLSPFNHLVEQQELKFEKYELAFERISPLLPVASEILGFKNKRKYFVGMQNPAQSRGTGGLLGTFAIITIDKGHISLEHVGTNSELAIQPDIPIQVPKDYLTLYGKYARSWNGSNFSPHFPYAARIWSETWRRMTGEKVDGVIAIDVFLLKSLLSNSQPVDIDGYVIDSKNVIEELLSKAYLRFESSPEKRKQYLTLVVRKIATRIIEGTFSELNLIQSLIDPLVENRIYLFLEDKSANNLLSLSPISGILDSEKNNEYRLVLQNISGNKMDYYMKRELRITSLVCSPLRLTKVDVFITNTAKRNVYLPAYVNSLRAMNYPNGNSNSQYAGIFLYGPTESTIEHVQLYDSGNSPGGVLSERNRTLFTIQTLIPANTTFKMSVTFKGGSGQITSVLQPLVIPQRTVIKDHCLRKLHN
jgi:Protein of unknown function (DUF4012)